MDKAKRILEQRERYLINSEVLNEPIHTHKKTDFLCPKCFSVWTSRIDSFSQGKRCPFCSGKKVNHTNWAYNNKDMRKWAIDENLLKKYTENSHKKLEWKCPKCSNIFSGRIDNFKRGNRCPNCKVSKGETFISDFLTEHNLNHQTQYKINDCKLHRILPFDHAIFDNENNLKGLIEYHGMQHEKPVKAFGGRAKFKDQIKRDLSKKQFCDQNNIPLLVIWYHEANIKERVEKFLFEIGFNAFDLSEEDPF